MAALDEKRRLSGRCLLSFGFGCAESRAGRACTIAHLKPRIAWVLSHVPDANLFSANPDTPISVSQDLPCWPIYSLFDQSKGQLFRITTSSSRRR